MWESYFNSGEDVFLMLKRYREVIHGMPARHIVLKSIGVSPDFCSMSEDWLWSLHDSLMQDYRQAILSEAFGEYIEPVKPSLLDLKIEIARRILENCHYCEIRCGADRFKGPGACGVDATSHISSEFLHMGEEPELIPSHTIFFEGCTFECVYCQNWSIAIRVSGRAVDPEAIARAIELRHRQGSVNVNFVGGDPTPHLRTILNIINHTSINIPAVWNSNMYMTPESMKLLEGTIDVYLADFRYGNDRDAEHYSSAKNYWKVTTRNFLIAREQAELLVRHLVLPGHVECCTVPIVKWCAENLGRDVRFNLMFQYRPEYRASNFPEINRPLTDREVARAIEIVKGEGLRDLV